MLGGLLMAFAYSMSTLHFTPLKFFIQIVTLTTMLFLFSCWFSLEYDLAFNHFVHQLLGLIRGEDLDHKTTISTVEVMIVTKVCVATVVAIQLASRFFLF